MEATESGELVKGPIRKEKIQEKDNKSEKSWKRFKVCV